MIIFFFFTSLVSYAQTTLTIEEVFTIALEKNIDIKIKKMNEK